MSSQSAEATCSLEITYADGKEATIQLQRDLKLLVTESRDFATGSNNFKSSNIKMGSAPSEHKEIAFMKEQLASAMGDAIESHAVGKEQSFGLEDAIKIVASTSQEVLEVAPSTSVDEVAKLETDKHLECQGTNSFLKQVRDELSGSKAGISEKIDVELEKPIMHLVEGEATKLASEESKISFRTTNPESVWRVEPTAAVCIKETVFTG